MDPTAEEEAAARNAKPITPSPGDADVDLISGLADDVLLRVLALLPDARDAARTAALSRRWRGLCPRVPALRFVAAGGGCGGAAEQRAALERYAAFVDGVLAKRAQSGFAIESLSIVYAAGSSDILEQTPPPPVFVKPVIFLLGRRPHETDECYMQRQLMTPACVDAVQGWIRNAFRHGVKSFSVDLRLPDSWREHAGDGDENVVLLDGLPSPARLETLRLALGGGIRLRLPSTVKFASLAHLSLERITIAAGGGGGARLLGHLVSSATCPNLQKLCMRNIYLHASSEEMRLEAAMLSELRMECVRTVMSLITPSLRVLHMYMCSHEMLTISAPKLEELAISFQPGQPPRCLEIQSDLLCVRRLKISLRSHRIRGTILYEAENDTNILLLKHCGSVTCLDVTLQGEILFKHDVDMIKSRVPELPHITSLIVNVSYWIDRHNFGAGVASLLTRFSNLRNLSLHLPLSLGRDCNMPAGPDLPRHHPDHWKSKDISMAYLLELELTGLTGTNCELWFMKSVLRIAKRVRKVAISFNKSRQQHQGKMDAFERMLLDEGMWASHRDEHVLRCLR